jgi:hypothetical protein
MGGGYGTGSPKQAGGKLKYTSTITGLFSGVLRALLFWDFLNSEKPILKCRMFQNRFCKVTGRRLVTEAEK